MRIVAALTLGLLSACGPKSADKAAAPSPAPAAATSPVSAAASTPAQVVEAIYASAAAGLGASKPSAIFDDALRARYFASDVAAAVKADGEAAAAQGEMGALEFDPISASQDPAFDGLKVTSETSPSDRALVTATFKAIDGQPVSLDYTLLQEQGAWRVADITKAAPDGWSLRQMLSLPPIPADR